MERQKHPYIDPPAGRPDIRMVWHARTFPTPRPLPPGYRLRQVQREDREAYETLHDLAWPPEVAFEEGFLEFALPGGFFAVEHLASGDLVSSCIAGKTGAWKDYPDTGSLGWTVTDPAHGGQGLGTIVVAAAMNRLAEEGYETVYLSTEDERVAAIHIYLKLGWDPLFYRDGMEGRWQVILTGQHRQYPS